MWNLPIDRPSYYAIHYWLKKNYGKANECDSVNCLGRSKRYEWAKITGKEYERKRENFMRLCRSCHTLYDYSDRTRKKNLERWRAKATQKLCKRGHELSGDNITVIPIKGMIGNISNTRRCKQCALIRERERRAKNPEAYKAMMNKHNALAKQRKSLLENKRDET